MQEDVYQEDGLNLYAYCRNNPVVYYDPSGYSWQEDMLRLLPNMSYEEKVEALYERRDKFFEQKKANGKVHYSNSGLIQGELDVLLAKYAKDRDNKSPHHMPSNASINKNERIERDYGASSDILTDTHKNTFTYGMGKGKRPYDKALYESLTYEDRIKFDHYDLLMVYAETRPNVDLDVVEYKLQKEYDLAMNMKGVRESMTLEGEHNMKILEEMKGKNCK